MAKPRGGKLKQTIKQQFNAPVQQAAGRDLVNKIKVIVQHYTVVVHDQSAAARERAAVAKAQALRALASRWMWAYWVAAAGWMLNVLWDGK